MESKSIGKNVGAIDKIIAELAMKDYLKVNGKRKGKKRKPFAF